MAKASIRVHSSAIQQEQDHSADAVSLVTESIAAIGMSDKEACLTMSFDASQFSKVKQGQARLPIDALWRLPDLFWADFADRVLTARGISEKSRKAERAQRVAEIVRLLLEEAA